jgi:drug/metabolite transporter (DMT)-like permease
VVRLWALVGIAGISFSAIFVRLSEASFGTSAFFRAAYAVPLLIVLMALWRAPDARPLRARALAWAAGLVFAANLVVWHAAIDLIGAGLSTVMGNTQVVVIGLVSWWLYGERPTRWALFAVPLVLVGVVLITGLGAADAYGAAPVAGVLLGVVTAFTSGSYVLLFRAALRVPSDAVHPAGPLFDVTVATAVGALAIGWAVDPGFTLRPAWPSHGWLLALALVSQVVGWFLIGRSLARLPALVTAVLMPLQPLLTVIWGRLLFAEALSAAQWVGVAVVLGGVLLVNVFGSVKLSPGRTSSAR